MGLCAGSRRSELLPSSFCGSNGLAKRIGQRKYTSTLNKSHSAAAYDCHNVYLRSYISKQLYI